MGYQNSKEMELKLRSRATTVLAEVKPLSSWKTKNEIIKGKVVNT
jgi:hypothetical protein